MIQETQNRHQRHRIQQRHIIMRQQTTETQQIHKRQRDNIDNSDTTDQQRHPRKIKTQNRRSRSDLTTTFFSNLGLTNPIEP